MAASSLPQTVDFWTAQAVIASGYLVRLYRTLGDDRQADRAIRACGPSAERASRLGLQAKIAILQTEFVAEHPDDALGEQTAWEWLLEAQAGLCAFHGLIDDHEQGGSLRGARTATTKAFHKSLQGYRAAFPDEMTLPGVQRVIAIAAARCADAFSLEVGEATEKDKAELRLELHTDILEALMQEAASKS